MTPNGKIAFFCGLLLLMAACAKNHEVNTAQIELRKDKTFRIGIVKVEGRRWGLFDKDNLEKKKEALAKVPVNDICAVLSAKYGLRIDTQLNNTVKVVSEGEGGGRGYAGSGGFFLRPIVMRSDNPYIGNKEYSDNGVVKSIFVDPSLKEEGLGDTVDIIYSYSQSSGIPRKDVYHYDITVKSNDTVLIHHDDDVAVLDYADNDEIYKRLVSYADKITDALNQDIGTKQQ